MNFVSFISRACTVLTVCVLLVGFTAKAEAMDYGPGTEGIKAATLPGPGFYYLMYNMSYSADKLMDNNGNESAVKPDVSAFVSVHRFVKITKYKFLGADYTFDLLFPVIHQDLEMKVGDVTVADDDATQLGDISTDVIALPWHDDKWDALFALAFTIPIGTYDDRALVNASKDHFSALFTLGGTYYPDAEKTWSASLQSRTEFHAKNRHDDITEGADFLLEGGVAKKFAGLIDAGVSGYAHWQVTKDTGEGATDEKEKQYAMGPEVDVVVPQIGAIVKAKYYKQFGSENTLEGDQFWINLVKWF
jgi:hypothetical protein